jgi:hypothetical protein
LWVKGLSAKDIHKKYFLFTVGSVYPVKRFGTGVRNVGNISLMAERLKRRCGSDWNKSQKLLRCGFRRIDKAMGQVYQFWWSKYREINVFPRFEYHMFYVLYPFVTFVMTLPRISAAALK